MDSFVAAVDETPTTPEVQEEVGTALVGAGFTNPEHLVGTADSVIGELAGWLAGPAGGLLKRTFRCAERRVGSQTRKGGSDDIFPTVGPPGVPSPEQLGCWIIAQPSWAGASALTAGSTVVDLNDMLEKAAIKDLPYHLRPAL